MNHETMPAQGPVGANVRARFEQWYLSVVKGHPNNLTRDENGGYKFIATLYMAFEAGSAVERLSCAKPPDILFDGFSVCEALDEFGRKRTSPENVSDVLDAVVRLMRSNLNSTTPGVA